jgi:protocatechuate 4,5-dioxygenase, beta chain
VAQVVGCVNTSHVPSIGRALARGLQKDPYWSPFFDGFPPIHQWLEEVKPDAAVVFYNDHGLNFFLNQMPTFAIGAAPQYVNEDEGWGTPNFPPFESELDLSWQLINYLVDHDFDMTICQEMMVDHAFALPLKLLFPNQEKCPIPTVPISINTVLYPYPSARRCAQLGKTVGDAIRAWDSDKKVLVIGTGGLSHQLEGERAGHLNKKFDLQFMDSLTQQDPNWLTQFSSEDIIEEVGTAGLEIIMWIAARNTLKGPVTEVHRNYHIPISNTAAGTQAFAPAIKAV